MRVDKWLWQARFFRTRTICSRFVRAGHVRLNGQKLSKPGAVVKSGDVLTFVQAQCVRVIKVRTFGSRRGPASEAQLLYEDLTPKEENPPVAPKILGKDRPTKQDRRRIDFYRKRLLE